MATPEYVKKLDPDMQEIYRKAEERYLSHADYDTQTDEWQIAVEILDIFTKHMFRDRGVEHLLGPSDQD